MKKILLLLIFSICSINAHSQSMSTEWVDCTGGTKDFIVSWSSNGEGFGWSSNSINMYIMPETQTISFDVED